MYGIKYNNKHSFKDLDLKVIDRDISESSKTKVTETIPFSNIVYDFSNLYGSQVFKPKKMVYTFQINEIYKHKLEFKRMEIENWLLYNNSKTKLEDDVVKGYYFLAECTETDFEDLKTYGKIKATFEAYPFRISTLQDGHDIWNEFNFELDMAQDTKFSINGTKTIKLYNNGSIEINPTITCSSEMKIIKGNTTYNLLPGTSKSFSFKLDKGLNDLTIVGNGTIEFKWYKELL